MKNTHTFAKLYFLKKKDSQSYNIFNYIIINDFEFSKLSVSLSKSNTGRASQILTVSNPNSGTRSPRRVDGLIASHRNRTPRIILRACVTVYFITTVHGRRRLVTCRVLTIVTVIKPLRRHAVPSVVLRE